MQKHTLQHCSIGDQATPQSAFGPAGVVSPPAELPGEGSACPRWEGRLLSAAVIPPKYGGLDSGITEIPCLRIGGVPVLLG